MRDTFSAGWFEQGVSRIASRVRCAAPHASRIASSAPRLLLRVSATRPTPNLIENDSKPLTRLRSRWEAEGLEEVGKK